MKKQLLNPICQAVGILSIVASPVIAQEAGSDRKPRMQEKGMHDKMQKFTKLIAMIHPVGESGVNGSVSFEKVADGVKVTANVRGLEPNGKHGFHVHEFGDLGSTDASSAGSHFNPGGHEHGLPDKEMRHAGDFGNLEADGDGNASMELTVKNLKLGSGPKGILGRAVIVHADEDDGSQPTGASGDRIAAGVIGISKDGMPEGKDADDRNGTDANPGAAQSGDGNDAQPQGNNQSGTGGPDYKPGTGKLDNEPKQDPAEAGEGVAPPEATGNKPGTGPTGAAD
jgi:Cu-Zn family superoxide dismutase